MEGFILHQTARMHDLVLNGGLTIARPGRLQPRSRFVTERSFGSRGR